MPSIKAGIPVSLTGQFRTQGRQTLAGLQAWAVDVNRAGGLTVDRRKYQVELVHYDDASLSDTASAASGALILDDRVDLLFGPYSSGLAGAAAKVSAPAGQILWNQGGAAEALYQPGSRIVGILSGAGEYLAALPGLLKVADSSARAFGILRCSTGEFPRQVSKGLEAAAHALGFTKSIHREFPPEQTEFRDLAQEAAAAEPDLLLVVGRIRHDVALAKALVSLWADGIRPRTTAVVAAPIARFRTKLGENVEGFVGPSQWEAPSKETHFVAPDNYFGPTPVQLLSSLSGAASSASVPIDYPMAQAYAAGLVAQRCAAEAASLEPGLLWAAAGRLDFRTFFGRFKIDPETGRQVGRSVLLVQWQGARKVAIWPGEQAEGNLVLS
jgi:branched-chain amino acid transport system substrate-binding protein